MDEARVSPDELLKKIKEEEEEREQGHLRIFFGYAAGVGKTYAMLRAAHEAKERGVDVLVGYVEPHTRPQTMALLSGLEQLAPQSIFHRGIEIKEFDLDRAVQRKPQLILVDELAHSNGEGCRHTKRYQDIVELLKAGIDVYTTVNVQHLESLNDMVASITGVVVRERIPDRIFDQANQVELVDIEPMELIDRLKEGKIYKEHQAQKALGNFFTVDNLVALREIALRRCADRVNQVNQRNHCATDEHILVCLSSAPTNPKIIRTASRMANAFKGKFTAVFVETPDFIRCNEENKKRLYNHIALARQLGATIETVYGGDVAFQIGEFARLSSVSKIVVGRNNKKRKFLFGKPSLTEQLIAAAPSFDIYIIPDQEASSYEPKRIKQSTFRFLPTDLFKSIGLLIVATLIGFLFSRVGFSEANIITIYILSVLLTAIFTTQRVYSLISSVVSVVTFNFFFTVPKFTLNAYDSGYPFTFLIMFLSAFLTGGLAVKIKQNARQSAQTAYRTKVLLETNQLLQKAKESKEIIRVSANQLTKLLKKDIVFYEVEKGVLTDPTVFLAPKSLEISTHQASYSPNSYPKTSYLSENEKAVAAWVYQNNKHAGASTNTLGSAKCLYLAVRVNESVYGVVGIAIKDAPLESFETSIVLSIIGECALALENQKVLKEREEAAVLAKNEQLRANLLRSISHDLRTPLTSISGNAGILLAQEDGLDSKKRKEMYSAIYEDSLWLINLVENLLSVTRIEDGSMGLHMTAELMEEIIEEGLHHIRYHPMEHEIIVTQAPDFLIAKMDAHLIVQVIMNLVDNAIKYTPVKSTIWIRTRKEKEHIVVEIADNGTGISDEDKVHIFDMFYTATMKSGDSRRSLGLGLALCKSIITAHGGTISVGDYLPKGTIFTFTLPAEEVILHE